MSKFPYPGYPIAPRPLRPILSVGLPVSFGRLADAFPLVADLDERVWSYVDWSVAEQLANLIVVRAGQMRSAPFWRLTYFPGLTQKLLLEDVQIEQPTYDSLRSLFLTEIPEGLAGLAHFTLDRLVSKVPGFGVKPLIDLLVAVHFYIDQSPISRPEGERLNRNDIEVMTRKPAAWRSYSQKYLPLIPQAASYEDLALSVRANNCIHELIRNKVISDFRELSQLTVHQLMKQNNFGVKSLAMLLDGIGPLAIEPVSHEKGSAAGEKMTGQPDATLSSNLTWAADRLSASRTGKRVRANDPRLHSLAKELLYVANNSSNEPPLGSTATLTEIARRLAVRTRDPRSPSEAVNLIEQIRLRLSELIRMSLEEELESLAARYIKGRNLNLMLILLGWNGDAPRTLESAGGVFGLTRARVQQIQAQFSKKSRHAKAFLPTLERVLRFVVKRVPALADDIEQELCVTHLTSRRFRAESIIEAAKWSGLPTPLVIDRSTDARVLLTRSEGTGLARLIAVRARRAVSKYGLANFVEMKEELADVTGSVGDVKLVGGVIRSMPSYEELGQGWFWLRESPRNHMLTIVRKIFAVAPRIHLSEMRAAIANDPRGMGFAPPKEVVMRFCRSAAHCEVDDDFLVIQQLEDPERVLSDTERIFFNIFCAHGPLLRREDLEKLCLERGMNRITLGLYLTRLAILARFSVGVYGLRGAMFSPSELERLSAHRQSRYSDHGWTENAQPWAAVELSASALASGVVQLPASFRQQMKGRYALRTEDGLTVGQLVVSDQATWGLGPLFRRRGGEPGDILLLTFNLQQREVTARLGDMTVIPEPGNLAEEVTG